MKRIGIIGNNTKETERIINALQDLAVEAIKQVDMELVLADICADTDFVDLCSTSTCVVSKKSNKSYRDFLPKPIGKQRRKK